MTVVHQVSDVAAQAELAALMRDVASRDEAAFKALYDRTSTKLFAVIRRIAVSEAAAEEALQEAWVRIWSHADRFDPSLASPMTWMTTIARHAAIDAIRKGPERVSKTAVVLDEELADTLPAPGAAPDGMAGPQLRRCLEGLEPERRGMVLLAYSYGYSREELSRRFDKPVATVKTILRRSLIALKECLGGR
ncbi:MAG: sigma-70 family RNA polymerase sigma factor [Candidatus Kaistia colombiensis]|nr:MAG: sigma-70 family RNA polymerase sigma factor [Kaistia sp.]